MQALSCGSPHAANGQSAHQPAQQQQQQQQQQKQWGALESTNLLPTGPARTGFVIPRPPHELK